MILKFLKAYFKCISNACPRHLFGIKSKPESFSRLFYRPHLDYFSTLFHPTQVHQSAETCKLKNNNNNKIWILKEAGNFRLVHLESISKEQGKSYI